MANERKKGSVIRESERVGAHYPESHYENPFNDGIDKWYAEGEDKRTLESPSENTIGHVGLPLRKGTYDKYYEGK
jgi:hypothetical protein